MKNKREKYVYSKRFRSILVDYILNDLGYNYSQTYCFSLCQQAYVTLTCGCSDLRGPVFKNNSNYCSPENLEIAGCLRDVIENFNSSQAAKCNEMCPFECDTAEYTISSNQALYPNKYYSEQVLKYCCFSKDNDKCCDCGGCDCDCANCDC